MSISPLSDHRSARYPTVSRPAVHPDWTGLTGRVESLFDDGRLDHLDVRPESAVVYVCGFRNTIAGAVRRLIGKEYVPEDRRIRRMLGIANDTPSSLFFEQYDLEPVFGPGDEALIASLRREGGSSSRRG